MAGMDQATARTERAELPLRQVAPPVQRGAESVSLIIVSAVVDALRQLGAGACIGPELASARASIGTDARAVMSRRRFVDALLELRARHGDPALGLAVGESLTEMSLHFVGPLLASRTTLREAMNTFFELKRAVLCGAPWTRESAGEYVFVGHALEPELGEGGELEAEIAVTALYRNVVHWIGVAGRQEVRVRFGFAAPKYLARYRAVFGDRVQFEQPLTGICIPDALLDRARPGADSALADGLREFAERWLPAEAPGSWSERVRREFASAASLAETDFEALAARWGMSLRSLRRRLEAENTGLRELLDEARFERARGWLAQGGHSLSQIGERLGYLEVNSFQRAFKRWAGVTPAEFRRLAQPAARSRAR